MRKSKLMFVGRGRSGKTALLKALLFGTFDENGLLSTVGAESVSLEVTPRTL